MASIISGGFGSLSGSANASTPQTILDFTLNAASGPATGLDGTPANAVTLYNLDGSNFAQIVIPGLHTTSTPFPIPPLSSQTFQLGLQGNDITKVQGWACTAAGATFSGNLAICGGVTIRRGG